MHHAPVFVQRAARILGGAAALVSLAYASGCAHVAPYERGKLAEPTMTADDLDGPAAAHALATHEGATGGGSLSESGCGCN